MASARYRFAPGLELALEGPAAALRHFAREYGPAAVAPAAEPPALRATIAWGGDAADDGHKTVRWGVRLGAPDGEPLVLELALRGRPRRFALSLVQGFLLEPVLSVAAARAGHVLLPAAGLGEDGAAVVVLGRSRSGKSSAMTLALAAGRHVLGDDQVLLDAAGGCLPFPRRLRLYPDLRQTAPAAFRRLPAADRGALLARSAARTLSRGWLAPSLAVRPSAVGPRAPDGPLPVRRLVAVERAGDLDGPVAGPLEADVAIALALDVLDEQRARLRDAAGPAWRAALDELRDREADLLRGALDGVGLERLRMPAAWPAPRGVAHLAGALGLQGAS
ncbi:MAG TPA: hypothetical protein VGJ32_07520 [Solirubrobacteraceae bacterium]